jgi:hypothetical protein
MTNKRAERKLLKGLSAYTCFDRNVKQRFDLFQFLSASASNDATLTNWWFFFEKLVL